MITVYKGEASGPLLFRYTQCFAILFFNTDFK